MDSTEKTVTLGDVKNVTLGQLDVGDGRLVAPGRLAENVDLANPAVVMHLASGDLLDVSAPTEPTAKERIAQAEVADLELVGELERAERARERPRKSVLEAIVARRAHLNAQETPS